jgi:hypothetical protein
MKKYKRNKTHIAERYRVDTLCGKNSNRVICNVFWLDSIKAVKSNPEWKGVKFCGNCMKIFKSKKIKQLTAEQCKCEIKL